jgi:hypothetical protein
MDPARIAALMEGENRRFVEEHARSLELCGEAAVPASAPGYGD